MNILFVGGPLDGKRQPLPEEHSSRVCVAAFEPPETRCQPDTRATIGFNQHVYTKVRLDAAISVMLHESVKHPLEALVKGYKRHRTPDRYPRPRRTSHRARGLQAALLLQSNSIFNSIP